jgi:putative acetyltransferase
MEFELQKKITQPMRELIALSDRYMNALYPAESNHLVGLDSLISESFEFYLLRDPSQCAGCIAIRHFADYAELKRMFVKKEFRGLGYGRRLLEFAAERCKQRGHKTIRLETGIYQPEATSLFEKIGFVKILPFGSYKPDPLSIFYERSCG